MRALLIILAVALTACRTVPKSDYEQVIEVLSFAPSQAERHFFELVWDANVEPDIAGYAIYLGPQSGPPYPARIEQRLWQQVEGRCYQRVLWHKPYTYARVAAFNAAGIEGEASDEVKYPTL